MLRAKLLLTHGYKLPALTSRFCHQARWGCIRNVTCIVQVPCTHRCQSKVLRKLGVPGLSQHPILRGLCSYNDGSKTGTEHAKETDEKSDKNRSFTAEDVDRELMRYNVEEFYPDYEPPEIEDFELQDEGADSKASDPVIVDEFYGIEVREQRVKPKQAEKPASYYARGVHGVYDVEDLLVLLREELVGELCVIDVPDDMNYADQIVIGTGFSRRHLLKVSQTIQKLWKKRRDPRRDRVYLHIEGESHCKDWLAMDLGNMVLHLFLEEARDRYDLETLWACGPEFDKKPRQAEEFTIELPDGMSLKDDPELLFTELQKKFFQNKDPSSNKTGFSLDGSQFQRQHKVGEETSRTVSEGYQDKTVYGNYLDDSEYVFENKTDTINKNDDEMINIQKLTGADGSTSYESKVGWHKKKNPSGTL